MYLNGRSALVKNCLLATPTEEITICSVVKFELFYGALRSNNPERNLERQQAVLSQFILLASRDESALVAGQIWQS